MRNAPRMLLVALLAAALAAPTAAQADSDPASDILLLQDVYLPVEPKLPQQGGDAIRKLAATTKRAGFPLKVAIIATPNDLGLVPQIFGKPQYYAGYLGREIDFNKKNQLLTVMPAGYGTNNIPPKVAASIKGLKPPGDDLQQIAESTVEAMVRMSRAAGHPVAKPDVGGGGSGGTSPAIIFGVPVLLLALAGGLAALRQRGQEKQETAAP